MADDFDQIHQTALAAFVRGRDVHCPVCKYNLRDCTIATCPECGKPIRLAVVALDLSVLAWGILTFVLSLPAGVGIVFLMQIVREGLPPYADREMRTTAFTFIGSIVLPLAALLLRQRFLRLSRSKQIALAWLGLAVAVGLFGYLLNTMMR